MKLYGRVPHNKSIRFNTVPLMFISSHRYSRTGLGFGSHWGPGKNRHIWCPRCHCNSLGWLWRAGSGHGVWRWFRRIWRIGYKYWVWHQWPGYQWRYRRGAGFNRIWCEYRDAIWSRLVNRVWFWHPAGRHHLWWFGRDYTWHSRHCWHAAKTISTTASPGREQKRKKEIKQASV